MSDRGDFLPPSTPRLSKTRHPGGDLRRANVGAIIWAAMPVEKLGVFRMPWVGDDLKERLEAGEAADILW
ncbi:MAG TPA: hypothetical protein VMY41_02730 [Thermohalobaculum sp.]|nr:hypothetical protein [Thermohalobaculum sp.]